MAQEGVYISRIEWNQPMKKIDFLEEFVKNSMKIIHKTKWMKPQEAMALIGCKCTKLTKLRMNGSLDWRYAGNGKGVMILRASAETYNQGCSAAFRHKEK